MLEEKGGWIVGEAQRHDVEMAEVVIEEMADANNQIEEGVLNTFRGQHGETLPPNLERSFSGFLVRNDALKLSLGLIRRNSLHALPC